MVSDKWVTNEESHRYMWLEVIISGLHKNPDLFWSSLLVIAAQDLACDLLQGDSSFISGSLMSWFVGYWRFQISSLIPCQVSAYYPISFHWLAHWVVGWLAISLVSNLLVLQMSSCSDYWIVWQLFWESGRRGGGWGHEPWAMCRGKMPRPSGQSIGPSDTGH